MIENGGQMHLIQSMCNVRTLYYLSPQYVLQKDLRAFDNQGLWSYYYIQIDLWTVTVKI